VTHRFRYGKREDMGISYLPFKLFGKMKLKEAEGQGYAKMPKEKRIYFYLFFYLKSYLFSLIYKNV
jgi:hypothetical protein